MSCRSDNMNKIKTAVSHFNGIIGHIDKNVTVVAGGAIRDLLLDKPIKDIDVYYFGDYFVPPEAFFPLGGHYSDEFPGEKQFEVYRNVDCGIQVDLIIHYGENRGIKQIFDNFCCNMSRVGCFLSGGIVIHESFLRGVQYKTLEFTPKAGKWYLKKMLEKYPDWSWATCESDLPINKKEVLKTLLDYNTMTCNSNIAYVI